MNPFRTETAPAWPIIVLTALSLVTVIERDASAELITVVNHSFEDISGETPFNEFTFGPLNGWQLYDPGNITDGGAGNTFFIGTLAPTAPTFFTTGASHGSRVGIAFNFLGGGGSGEYGMQQQLSATLEANVNYSLQVDVGNIASGTAANGEFFPLDGFPGYRVDLLAGGQVIASDNNSLSGSIPEGAFSTSTIQFTATSGHSQIGQVLGIRLVNLNLIDSSFPDSDLEVDFDNVRMNAVTAIPEPSSLIFLLFCSLCTLPCTRLLHMQEPNHRNGDLAIKA